MKTRVFWAGGLWLSMLATAMASPPRGEEPLQIVTAPAALQAAESAGAGLARWFDAMPGADGLLDNRSLARSPRWRELQVPLADGVAAIARGDPQAGVGVARYAHRLFDSRWLHSPDAFFELVGVVNRLDRRAFHDGACGETRLVYRLAYRTPRMQSRLPMTLSVELRADPPDAQGSCAAAARLWVPPPGLDEPALGRWLLSPRGPLAPDRLERQRLVQIAVNLQSVRWPSGVRPDLGGHAEYLLRAFRWNATPSRYEAGPLENTPDLARLQADARLREDLLRWLQQPAQRQALDSGQLRIPERYLATEARSVTPRGLARLANRPFVQLYGQAPWQAVPGSHTLGSPAAWLRRLDDLSCTGCHQSRAVAGFHLLGEDRPGATRTFTPGNALAVAHSPHVQDELARRAAYLDGTLAQGRADPFRPLAEHGGPAGGLGAACGLGDAGFEGWRCAAGLRCQAEGGPSHDGSVGVCMPERPAVGAMCEPARLTPRADARLDRALRGQRLSCGDEGVCEKTAVGFPGGMCSSACKPGDPDGVCGQIAILDDFNRCLAEKKPFAQCLQHTRPGQLRRCSATRACRDDYVCAQVAQPAARLFTSDAGGACMPPYFLFQMRVDGHP